MIIFVILCLRGLYTVNFNSIKVMSWQNTSAYKKGENINVFRP